MDERDVDEREAGRPGEASREPRFGDSPKPHGDKLPRRGGATGGPADGGANESARAVGEDPTHDAAGRPADDA